MRSFLGTFQKSTRTRYVPAVRFLIKYVLKYVLKYMPLKVVETFDRDENDGNAEKWGFGLGDDESRTSPI